MKKTLLIAMIVILCVGIGFFVGSRLFKTDNTAWQEQYDLGIKYLKEGEYEEAIIAFSAAITIDPYQTPAYMRRVEAYAGVGGEENYRKALQDCETILSQDDTLTSVWIAASDLLERLEGPTAALDFLQGGLEKAANPDTLAERKAELEQAAAGSLLSRLGVEYMVDILGMDKDSVVSLAEEETELSDTNQIVDARNNPSGDQNVYTYWKLSLIDSHIALGYTDASKSLHLNGLRDNEIFEIWIGDSMGIENMNRIQLAKGIVPQMTVNQVRALSGSTGYIVEENDPNLVDPDPLDEGITLGIVSDNGWYILFCWIGKAFDQTRGEYVYTSVDYETTMPSFIILRKLYNGIAEQSMTQVAEYGNSEPEMANYLGIDIDNLIELYGNDYYIDYWEGGRFIKFASVDAMFFYEQSTNSVFCIVCGGSEHITRDLRADMTYTELREAVPAGVILGQPETYLNQMDDRYEYNVRFSIEDLNLCYKWLDSPFVSAPYEVTIDGVAPQTAKISDAIDETDAAVLRFSEIPSEYLFTSGAGAWSTELIIAADGSFEGSFHDSNMGETGVDHPNGTVYYCGFTGKFSEPVQINHYVYKMNLITLATNDIEGYSYIENGVKYIAGTPYGFDGPTEYYLYLPGIPAAMMPESCFTWIKRLEGDKQGTCNSYVICSSNGELPFIAVS